MRRGIGFWLLTGGEVIQNVGNHFLTVAVSAYAYAVTGSAWGFALQQLVMFLPWTLFATIAGPIIDRVDRRRVLVAADWSRALICLMYPLCHSLRPILVLNFLNSTTRVFAASARTALVPGLCNRERLLEANGLRTSIFGIVDMFGPALSGALMVRIGTTTAFWFTSLAVFLGSLLFLWLPATAGKTDINTAPEACRRRSFVKDIGAGMYFLKRRRALLASIFIYCAYIFGQNGINSVFYPYVNSVLKAGPAVFGFCVSTYYGANFLVGMFMTKYGDAMRRRPLVLFMVPGTFIWAGYSVVRFIPVMLVMSFVEGIIFSLLSTLFLTRIQTEAPSDMIGRVWGLANSMTSFCEASGILVSGLLAERLGIPGAYRVIGLTICCVVGVLHLSNEARTPAEAE